MKIYESDIEEAKDAFRAEILDLLSMRQTLIIMLVGYGKSVDEAIEESNKIIKEEFGTYEDAINRLNGMIAHNGDIDQILSFMIDETR